MNEAHQEVKLFAFVATSSSDVLLDLNLKTLIHRREISILRYFCKIIFRLVPCPLNLFRSFGEFVPYTLRHNLDVQIPLFKKSLAFNFFSERPVAYGILSPCSLWNSLPLEIKSSPSHPNFVNRLMSYYHVAKQNTTFWELILAWHLSVVCFASPTVHWISIKNHIVLAFAVISKLRFTFSFTVIFMLPHVRSSSTGSIIL